LMLSYASSAICIMLCMEFVINLHQQQCIYNHLFLTPYTGQDGNVKEGGQSDMPVLTQPILDQQYQSWQTLVDAALNEAEQGNEQAAARLQSKSIASSHLCLPVRHPYDRCSEQLLWYCCTSCRVGVIWSDTLSILYIVRLLSGRAIVYVQTLSRSATRLLVDVCCV
jgi:hypothetical protein